MRSPSVRLQNHVLLPALLLVASAYLASCSSVIRMYEGKKLPREQLATLGIEGYKKTDEKGIYTLVMVLAVDSTSMLTIGPALLDKFRHGRPLAILPGTHTVTVEWYKGKRFRMPGEIMYSRPMTLEFTAEAGRDYLITGAALDDETSFAAFIVDKATNEEVQHTRVDKD